MIRKAITLSASAFFISGLIVLSGAGLAAAAPVPSDVPMVVREGSDAPVQPLDSRDCNQVSNTPTPESWIAVCVTTYSIGTDVGLNSGVGFGVNSTSATGCKVTGYLRLARGTARWNGPKVTRNCTVALLDKGLLHTPFYHWTGFSSATSGSGRVCIDLYYNFSDSSGWQRCHDGPWSAL